MTVTRNAVLTRPASRQVPARPAAPPWYRWALLAIMVLALVRGLFWLAATPVFFGDEMAHQAYVESVATGHGLPTVGRTFVPDDLLTLYKDSPVHVQRSDDIVPRNTVPSWGLVRDSYEGDQPPTYYVLMAPFWWIGHWLGGTVGALWVVRLATLLVSLLAIPLLAALARDLFPRRPAVWVLAPAVLVTMQLVNSTAGAVDNDSLVIVFSLLSALALARGGRGLNLGGAVAFGAATALAFCQKGTFMAMVPLLVFGLVALAVHHRRQPRRVLGWLVVAGVALAVLVVPWLAWNEHVYGALTGARAHTALTVAITHAVPVNGHEYLVLLDAAWHGLFHAESASAPFYARLWQVVAAALFVGGVVVSLVRRRRRDAVVLVLLAAGVVLGAFLIIGMTLLSFGPGAAAQGRYLNALMPFVSLIMAVGALNLFGSRVGATALMAFLVTASVLEIQSDRVYVNYFYTAGVTGKAAPVVDQSYADTSVTASTLAVSPTCPARLLALGYDNPAQPPPLVIGGKVVRASSSPAASQWSIYALPVPTSRPFVVRFPAPVGLRAWAHHPGARVAVPGTTAAPVSEVYCDVAHPDAARFAQLWPPYRPFSLSYAEFMDWPLATAALAALLALVGVAAMGADALGHRGSGRRDPAHRVSR